MGGKLWQRKKETRNIEKNSGLWNGGWKQTKRGRLHGPSMQGRGTQKRKKTNSGKGKKL